MEENLKICEITEIKGVTVIEMEISRTSIEMTSKFKEILFDLIERQSKNKLLFDLSKVEFVESSFLGVIVFAYRNIMQRQGQVKFLVTNALIYDRFTLTQLDKLFEIYQDKEIALKSFY